MEDATLYHGTYETTGVGPGAHSDVTQVTDTNFKEVGTNPGGIADWEAKFQAYQAFRLAEFERMLREQMQQREETS